MEKINYIIFLTLFKIKVNDKTIWEKFRNVIFGDLKYKKRFNKFEKTDISDKKI